MKKRLKTFYLICALFVPLAQSLAQTTAEKGNANQFAIDVYKKLTSEEKNVFFSPVSISSAIAVAYEGARGETKAEIKNALRFPKRSGDTRVDFQNLNTAIETSHRQGDVRLSIANALWIDEKLSVKRSFLDVGRNYYSAEIGRKNFREAPEPARAEINYWVEEKTEKRIKDLLPSGSVNPLTRLVITNAIYFKGDWKNQFDKKLTHYADFLLTNGETKKVKLMNRELTVPFLDSDKIQLVELPYKGEEISMVILLPKEKGNLSEIEELLSAEQLSSWMASASRRKINLFLPTFKSETEFVLNNVMSKLGMKKAFTSDADFSGITTAEKLFISLIIHKAFVEVNEEGTEAAAATGMVMRTLAFQPKPEFRADHPFLYLIREKRTNTILFMGRMNDPRKG